VMNCISMLPLIAITYADGLFYEAEAERCMQTSHT